MIYYFPIYYYLPSGKLTLTLAVIGVGRLVSSKTRLSLQGQQVNLPEGNHYYSLYVKNGNKGKSVILITIYYYFYSYYFSIYLPLHNYSNYFPEGNHHYYYYFPRVFPY